MEALIQHLHRELSTLNQLVHYYRQLQEAIIQHKEVEIRRMLATIEPLTDELQRLEEKRIHLLSQLFEIPLEEARALRLSQLLNEFTDATLQKALFKLHQAFKEEADKLQRTILITSFLIRRALQFSESALEALLGKHQSLYNLQA